MPRPKGQRCDNCIYSVHYETSNRYECQRLPPTVIEWSIAYHPDVSAGNWCGEWGPTNPQTVEQAATEMARFVLLGDLSAARGLADRLIELDQK